MSIKKKSIRCNNCNKKIKSLLPLKCKCEKYYCGLHKLDHGCDFDYKKEYQEVLEKENPVVKHDKLERV